LVGAVALIESPAGQAQAGPPAGWVITLKWGTFGGRLQCAECCMSSLGAIMFTIEYVTSRASEASVETVAFDGRSLEGAVGLAEFVLLDIMAGTLRRAAPVIGYVIRDGRAPAL
jgi:hypothetical protein